jgi:hypothetical protein
VGDDTKDSVCVPFIIPPTPKVVDQNMRLTTYTAIQLNNGGNVYYANPGENITLTGHRQTVYNDLTNYCPGCVTQLYIGMAAPGGTGNVFTSCFDVSLNVLTGPGNSQDADFNFQFVAPTEPGVYYITQESSWQYTCYGNDEGYPTNNPAKAFAVVVVNVSNTEITASVNADIYSPAGDYPIVLQGCDNYSPNYDVTLQDGTLTVGTTSFAARSGTGAQAKNSSTALVVDSKGANNNLTTSNRLYPNPAITKIRLDLEEAVASKDLRMYDMIGKVTPVSSRKVGERSHELDVSRLKRGVYFIQVRTSTGIRTFRFVKM